MLHGFRVKFLVDYPTLIFFQFSNPTLIWIKKDYPIINDLFSPVSNLQIFGPCVLTWRLEISPSTCVLMCCIAKSDWLRQSVMSCYGLPSTSAGVSWVKKCFHFNAKALFSVASIFSGTRIEIRCAVGKGEGWSWWGRIGAWPCPFYLGWEREILNNPCGRYEECWQRDTGITAWINGLALFSVDL